MRKIKILGRTYKVFTRPIKDVDKVMVFGFCDYRTQEIHLHKKLCRERKLETTLHEIVHVLDGDMGIGLSEKQVARLAVGLAGVALENPRLFKGE